MSAWVACAERMPDPRVRLIVWIGSEHARARIAYLLQREDGSGSDFKLPGDRDSLVGVTHWMPLPAPPEVQP